MSGRLLYLASPLDGVENHDPKAWYDEFDAVRPADVLGFMPGRAYLGASAETSEALHVANRAVLAASLGLVVNLAGPGRALGTMREIESARALGKPVIVIGDMSRSLAAWDLRTVGSIEEAADALAGRR